MTQVRFGTDGWRAIIAKGFTFANLRMVAQGIAAYVNSRPGQRKTLVVAYDNRFLSPECARECAQVLAGNGIKVSLLKNASPTPLAAFAVRDLECHGAVVITASHNHAHYNGIKFIPAYAGPASPEVTAAIEAEIRRVCEGAKIYEIDLHEAAQLDLFTEIDTKDDYLEHLAKILHPEYFKGKSFKVVVDPMYGAGIGYLEEFLGNLGVEVKAIHNHRDVLFGNGIPEPVERNLSELQRAVVSYNADIGLALDGDADRFGIISAHGSYVNGNLFLALLLEHWLETRTVRGSVVRSVATTHMLDRIARKNGLQLIETPVGFKYISRAMRDFNGLLGGEESGGLSVWGHIPDKDGILACLLAVEILAYSGSTYQELSERLYERYGRLFNRRHDIGFIKGQEVRWQKRLEAFRPKTIAGLKVLEAGEKGEAYWSLAEDSWVLARFSDTEPILRIYTESTDLQKLDAIEKALLQELAEDD